MFSTTSFFRLMVLSMFAAMVVTAGAAAQITTHIEGYSKMVHKGNWAGLPRPFVGTFDFIKLPGPLQEAEVDFVLTAQLASEEDWDVSVWALDSENRVDIIGDSVHVWNAPIAIGDEFRGTIRFVPLTSGATSIDVGALKFGGIEVGLTITWCLSEDGDLLCLGSWEIEPKQFDACKTFTTHFFPADSVYMFRPAYLKGVEEFDYETVIKPVPKVGDTSFITYKLTANKNFPDGMDFYVTSYGIEVVSVPGPMSDPIAAGQHLELTVGIVPRAVNTFEYLALQVFDDLTLSPKSESQEFRTDFIFDDVGTLRYTSIYPMPSEALSRVPTSFRRPDQRDSGRITVWKTGEVQRNGEVIRCTGPAVDKDN